MDMSEQYTNCE